MQVATLAAAYEVTYRYFGGRSVATIRIHTNRLFKVVEHLKATDGLADKGRLLIS